MNHAQTLRILVGLAGLLVLSSCGFLEGVAEFAGLATGDPSPDDVANAADRNGDGLIEGWGEWAYLLLLGGAAGAAKTARMMGVPIPKLGGFLDKVGLGRTANQQQEDRIWQDIKADHAKFDTERLSNAIKVAEQIERENQESARAEA